MMKAVIAGVFVSAMAMQATHANAESWFQLEAGIGASHVSDMGDGTWIQEGAKNNQEHLNSPALMAGFTGKLYQRGNVDVRYHSDYVYLGTYTASVDGVPDANYNPVTHTVHNMPAGERYSPFNGQGHTQGVPLTLDVGYTWRGFRFGVEGGAWVYWQTWHESLYDLGNNWDHFKHDPKAQFGYVAGANVSRGNLSLSYRYYQIRPDWSTGTPGLATGAQVLMATYRTNLF
jgi:hypothetical protein